MGSWSKNGHRLWDSIAWLAFEAGGVVDRRILLLHSEEKRHLHNHAFLRSRHQVPNTKIDVTAQE